jgi:Zn-finger nucleic acid-binding protein
VKGSGDGPYRGGADQSLPIALVREEHPAGVAIERCRACGGAFVQSADLRRIEDRGRRASSAAVIALRGFDPAYEDIRCVACGGETNRREWSMNTLVYVDVCIECQGVWLDAGELDALT